MHCLVEIMRPLLADMKENTNAQTRQSGACAAELPRPYFPCFLVHVGSAVHAIVLMHDEKYGRAIFRLERHPVANQSLSVIREQQPSQL